MLHMYTPKTEFLTLSLHDALPILFQISDRTLSSWMGRKLIPWIKIGRTVRFKRSALNAAFEAQEQVGRRSEEHTSELQSLRHLVCRLLLEKKKMKKVRNECGG